LEGVFLNMAITIKLEKSGRSIGYLSVLGFLFLLCTLAMIVKIAVDTYRENKHAKWPGVVATITQQGVRQFMNGRHEAWRIESEVRYAVDGEELTSNIHSGIGNFLEERAMRRWAAQHPPGTSLPIRDDPDHYNIVVPETGDMPETGSQVPADLKAILIFSILSIILIIIGRSLQRRQGTTNKAGGDLFQ
jgi:hypothetical protein